MNSAPPEESPEDDSSTPVERVYGVFNMRVDPSTVTSSEEIHSKFRMSVFYEIFSSALGKNHSREEIERFVQGYIRDAAVSERGRLLLGRKFSTLPAEFLDLIELASTHAVNFAERGRIDEYWLRQYGFNFLRLLATWDFKTVGSIAEVLRKRQELMDQGICDAKGNDRVRGKGRDRISDKALILKFVNETIRDAGRLPTKQEVRRHLEECGRNVGGSFYSERLAPLGLEGLPDNSSER